MVWIYTMENYGVKIILIKSSWYFRHQDRQLWPFYILDTFMWWSPEKMSSVVSENNIKRFIIWPQLGVTKWPIVVATDCPGGGLRLTGHQAVS